VRKSRGLRADSRSLLRRSPRERGKLGLSKILREYNLGEKVVIDINPSVHRGMPHRRFQGKVGVIVAVKGRAYTLSVTQGNGVREIIARPEHLKPHSG